MSEPFIVPKKSGKMHREKLHKKHCVFPKCNKVFMGTGKSCYCTEHRKRKYRKIIDDGKAERKLAQEEVNSVNKIIRHKFTDTTIVKMKCHIEGCDKEFEIKVLPGIFVYPKFCENHRNSWRREYFLKQNKE